MNHIYQGLCPDRSQPGRRDPNCPACQILATAEGRWVPVAEQLPPNRVRVWVADQQKQQTWVGECWQWPDEHKWYRTARGCRPTHWMPLPAPPALEGEAGNDEA